MIIKDLSVRENLKNFPQAGFHFPTTSISKCNDQDKLSAKITLLILINVPGYCSSIIAAGPSTNGGHQFLSVKVV